MNVSFQLSRNLQLGIRLFEGRIDLVQSHGLIENLEDEYRFYMPIFLRDCLLRRSEAAGIALEGDGDHRESVAGQPPISNMYNQAGSAGLLLQRINPVQYNECSGKVDRIARQRSGEGKS